MSLNRSSAILKYIVEYFIKTAQPVGSKTLIEEYNLPYSSATIRNEMATLEQLGYIEKTHLSSGRVPSSKGYKYYCEHLREHSVDEEIKNSIQEVLQKKTQSIEETIKASCEIISHMTSLVSVVLGPDESMEKLASVQLIKVNNNTLTAIFVTDTGYVENKTFIVESEIDSNDVVKCVELLNDRLVGTPVGELVEKMESLKPILNDYIVDHDVVYQAVLQTFLRFASDRLSLYGKEELFSHPEFKNDVDKLEKVVKMLNDSTFFKESSDDKENNGLLVNIGDIEDNPDVTMLKAKIKIGDDVDSTIALIGPTRMDYDKALGALEYLASALNDYFDDKNKGGKA